MTTIASNIFNILTEEIISGLLKPGTKLEEIALATRFKVSRTPIREVLRDLAAKGLVQLVPRKGVLVAEIGIDELSDMLEAECELEALCAQIAAHRMSLLEKKQLERVHELADQVVKKSDANAYLELNKKFHNLICLGTHNQLLNEIVGNLRTRLSGFRQAQSKTEKRLQISHHEHQLILEAILNSDSKAAFESMRAHNARLSSKVVEQLSNSKSR
jgi:DNA-binding GntR family transcriptional regulator